MKVNVWHPTDFPIRQNGKFAFVPYFSAHFVFDDPFLHVQSNCHNLSSFEPVTSANIVSPYPKITVAHIHCLVRQSRHILFVSVRTVSHSQADCVPLLNFASDGERTLACQFSVSKNVGGRTGDDTIVFKY